MQIHLSTFQKCIFAAVAAVICSAGWLPLTAFADTFFDWGSYTGGSASIDTHGVFHLTGESDLIIHFDSTNVTYGGGGYDGTFPGDNINNQIFGDYGATSTSGYICFTRSSSYGTADYHCDDPTQWVYFDGVVAGYASSSDNVALSLSSFSGLVSQTQTGIYSIAPAGGSTVATSTSQTLSFGVNILPSDFQSGDFLQVKLAPNSNVLLSVANPNANTQIFKFPINSSGAFIYSTTTSLLQTGQMNITAQIIHSSFLSGLLSIYGLDGLNTTNGAYATSSTFIVATSSQLDIFEASTIAALNAYVASTSPVSWAKCQPLTFDFFGCYNLLFFPQIGPTVSALQSLSSDALSRAPWGYVFRMDQIWTTAPTTTLPSLVIHTPTFLAGLPSYTVDLTPWNALLGPTSMLSTATNPDSGHTIRQIVEPGWDTFVYVCFWIYIISQILGISYGQGQSQAAKVGHARAWLRNNNPR